MPVSVEASSGSDLPRRGWITGNDGKFLTGPRRISDEPRSKNLFHYDISGARVPVAVKATGAEQIGAEQIGEWHQFARPEIISQAFAEFIGPESTHP